MNDGINEREKMIRERDTEYLDEIDPTFVDDLKKGRELEWHIARWLCDRHKLAVVMRPMNIRNRSSEWRSYTDEGFDLIAVAKGQNIPIGVKGRGFEFNALSDEEAKLSSKGILAPVPAVPYPYPTVIVDSKARFDDPSTTAPKIYYIVNKSHTKAIVIDVEKTRSAWDVFKAFTNNGNRTEELYVVPKELCKIIDITMKEEDDG